MKVHLDRAYETENYDPSVRAAFEPLLKERLDSKRSGFAYQCLAMLLSGKHDTRAMSKHMAGDWSPPMRGMLIGLAIALDSVDRLKETDDLELVERFLSILTDRVTDHQEGEPCFSTA